MFAARSSFGARMATMAFCRVEMIEVVGKFGDSRELRVQVFSDEVKIRFDFANSSGIPVVAKADGGSRAGCASVPEIS